jgi:hypothetical protein
MLNAAVCKGCVLFSLRILFSTFLEIIGLPWYAISEISSRSLGVYRLRQYMRRVRTYISRLGKPLSRSVYDNMNNERLWPLILHT